MRVQHKKSKKALIFIPLAIIIFIGGYFAYAITNHLWPFSDLKNSGQNSDKQKINYSPPTQTEVENSQDGKKNSGDNNTSNPPVTTEGKTNVPVEVSYADKTNDGTQVDIRAFTPGVIEGTGECTAILTQADKTVSASSKAFIDASSTICEPILIPVSKFSSTGKWNLVVTYSSPTSSGESKKIEVSL